MKGLTVDSPESWILVWLAIAGFFLVGEIFVAGTFFLLPFGVSALVAMVLSIFGAPIWIQWATFVVLGIGLFMVMLRWGQRFQAEQPLPVGIGADRLVGEIGPVTETLPAGPTQSGRVQIGAEDWAAESVGNEEIEAGTVVEVIEVRGTRVIVSAVAAADKTYPKETSPDKTNPDKTSRGTS